MAFLERIGSPHIGRPVVHIGGTSGKGSTSTIIAAILTAAGYRTGLHTSPYLQTPAEKLQVDGQLVSPQDYVELVNEFFVAHDAWLADGQPPLTYGEAWNTLTWLFFRQENVDIGVVEVGAGGRFDLTNFLTPVLSIITSVGIDHTNTLGSTIEDIAWHKAGIIKPGIPALTTVPNPVAREIIIDEAKVQGAPITVVDLDNAIEDIQTTPQGTTWSDRKTGVMRSMGMCGTFQARNGQTAVAAANLLSRLGIAIPSDAIDRGLRHARIPGRAELINGKTRVLLDGAHNAEKLAALVADVPALLPAANGARRIGVIGLLDAKKGEEMIRSVVPVIDVLIATSPQVLAKEPKDAEAIARLAREAGFTGDVLIEPDASRTLDLAFEQIDVPRGDMILVTGSLYLVGNVRGRWFPESEIVSQRTPWPGSP